MGVAVLIPQDCLKQPFSYMKYARNPTACPNRQKKLGSNNRTRRSPPRNQATRSPPPRNQATRSPPPRNQATRSPPPRNQATRSPPPRNQATISPPPRNQATRSPPPRNQATRSPPRAIVSDVVPNKTVVVNQVRILKRGEEIPKKTSDLIVEKSDLGSTRRIGPDPDTIPSQIRLSHPKSKVAPFYAGPVTLTSPPPSDLPVPAFFSKKSIDATNDIIRMLRINIA